VTSTLIEVAAPPLARGTHELRVELGEQAIVATSAFEVTNEGLASIAVRAAATPGDPITLGVSTVAPAGGFIFAANVGGREVTVDGSGAFQLDPWALDPGVVEVSVQALVDGAVAWSDVVTVPIPALEPELSAFVRLTDQGHVLVVDWRAQGVEASGLTATSGGELLFSTAERHVEQPVKPGAEIALAVTRADGSTLAETSLIAAAPSAGGMTLVSWMALAGMMLAVIVGWAFALARRGILRWPAPPDLRKRRRLASETAAPAASRQPAHAEPAAPVASATASVPAPAPQIARLEAVAPDGSAHELTFRDGPISIGSSPQCDLSLEGHNVRFVHVVMDVIEEGIFRLHFFGPMAPTASRDEAEQQMATREARMRFGDTFRVGGYLIRIAAAEGERHQESGELGSVAA
jgi:hypothetical protein